MSAAPGSVGRLCGHRLPDVRVRASALRVALVLSAVVLVAEAAGGWLAYADQKY